MSRRPAREQILIFGEDDHDRQTVKILLKTLRPDLEKKKITPLRTPITLVRGMRPDTARARHDKILDTIKAANRNMAVAATLLHEDADAIEPAHLPLIRSKEDPLTAAPGRVAAVVPAWELETWWLLFPDQVKQLRPAWRNPDKYVNRDAGQVANSKEELVRLLRPDGRRGRVPDYEEKDSPDIARLIADAGVINSPRAKSDSWHVFVEKMRSL